VTSALFKRHEPYCNHHIACSCRTRDPSRFQEKEIALIIAFAASTAMLLPVSTPLNAIAFSTGMLEQKISGLSGVSSVCLWTAAGYRLGASDLLMYFMYGMYDKIVSCRTQKL
jgi:hypothetical protein